MISVILFDVGNVLLTFTPESYYRPLLAAEKYEETMQLLFNTQHWHHYDQGLYTEEELKQLFLGEAPHLASEIHFIFDTYMSLLAPIEPMVTFAKELKKNYRISILSNMPEKSAYYIDEAFLFLKEFELPLYSYAYRLIKPDPAIYLTQLNRLQVEPQEVLFIDDRQVNLDAAKDLGIKTILMTTPEETIPKIKALLEAEKDSEH